MNREERRKFLKRIKGNNLTEVQKKLLFEYEDARREGFTLSEGEKVKIDYEKIVSEPNYENKLETYKSTIESLKDKECTVVYDKKYTKNPLLVCLEEDEKEVKRNKDLYANLKIISDVFKEYGKEYKVNPNFSESDLNETERKNIELIREMESITEPILLSDFLKKKLD